MPQITVQFSDEGPLVQFWISVSLARRQLLEAKSLKVPRPQKLTGIIDTGASCTCIAPAILNSLHVEATGTVTVHSTTTGLKPMTVNQYDIGLALPANQLSPDNPFRNLKPGLWAPQNRNVLFFERFRVIESDLSGLGLDIKALIGRDVLDRCLFVYNGRERLSSLNW